MEYSALAGVLTDLEATRSVHEKRDILAELFEGVDEERLPMVISLVRGKVFAPWESGTLGVSTSLTMASIAKATGIEESRIERWWREDGDLGAAAETAVADRTQQTLVSESLTVTRVFETLREVATYEGDGSQQRRVDAIASLVSDATPLEARYVVRTVVNAMRLGIGEGIIRDALAAAFLDGSEDAVDAVQRAYEVTNDFALVAERARSGGVGALRELDVEVFRPVKPMLAGTAEDVPTAIRELADDDGMVAIETKYDGLRAKLHRADGEARMFTRRLEDVTAQFPEVIEAVEGGVDAEQIILEGEVVGYDPDTGVPLAFQELSRRIKRKYDIEAMAEEIPVTVHLFDVLYLNGDSLLEAPLRRRLAELETVLDVGTERIDHATRIRTASESAAQEFYEAALADGHEGIMVKNLDATYQPGTRVGYQLKVKSTMEHLDLVVTRAKYSEGRKRGFLGRPYLACRDRDGSFLEVGRMHTGFTDDQLAEFTDLVEPLIQEVDGREAILRPEVVLEVEYEELQQSPKYDSGYALRFPRLKRIRTDLDPEDADTHETVERLYDEQ